MSNVVLRAIITGWRVAGRKDRVVAVAVLLAVPLAGGTIGGGLVEGLRKPRTVTVTEYKDRIVTQEKTVTVEKPVVKWRTRTVRIIEYRDNGSVAKETDINSAGGSQAGGKTTTTDERTTEDKSGVTKTVTNPEGRWSFRVLAGADSGGSVVAGAAGEYRLVGPLTIGAWATAPVAGAPGRFTVGASAGMRF